MGWITNRPPTEADADVYGDVVIATEDGGGWGMDKWYNVPQSTAWLAFKPADAANFLNSIAAAAEAGQPRPIVNIALDADSVAAVADDGTAWWLSSDGTKWTQMPALPDREVG